MAWFTHALPGHRQQHPDEFCHIFTELDECKRVGNCTKESGCFHLRTMQTFLIILPSSNIFYETPSLLTCGGPDESKHWDSTVPPTVWLPTFVGLHNGTTLQRGYNFSVNQFSQLNQWEFFFSQWLLMVCYHYLVTNPNLKPIFCVHSSIKPVNVISNAFINDENQLFETVEPS